MKSESSELSESSEPNIYMKVFTLNFNKTHVVSHSDAWYALSGKTVKTEATILHQIGDVHPFKASPIIESSTVIFDRCDKNFIYYWLNDRKTFTGLKKVYIGMHPCEPAVIRWLEIRSTISRQKRGELLQKHIEYNNLDASHKERIMNYVDNPLEVHVHEYYYNYVDRWSLKNIYTSKLNPPGLVDGINKITREAYNNLVNPIMDEYQKKVEFESHMKQ